LTGNAAAAVRHFERAASLEKPAFRRACVLPRCASHRATRRERSATSKVSPPPTGIRAGGHRALRAHMSRRQYDKALAVLANVEKKQPGAAVHELRGNVMLAKRDYKAARTSYAKALELEPARLSAARRLAGLDLLDNKPADARARYEKMIEANPKSESLQIALAETLALSGAPPADVKGGARQGGRRRTPTRARRGSRWWHTCAERATRVVRWRPPRRPRRPCPRTSRYWRRSGAATGQRESAQARATFAQVAELQPGNPAATLRVAATHVADKDFAGAIELQRKVLAAQPNYGPAILALAATQIAAGKSKMR